MGRSRRKPGPQRREDVARYPGGQVKHAERGERPEAAMAAVLAQRARVVGVEHAASSLAENPLGRLVILHKQGDSRGITSTQHEAAKRYSLILARRAIIDGTPLPRAAVTVLARMVKTSEDGASPAPAAPGGIAMSDGLWSTLDPDRAYDATDLRRRIDAIDAIRRAHAEAQRVILDLEQSATYRGVTSIMRRVCYHEEELLDPMSIGLLRSGCNVLARLWRLGH